MRQELYLQGRWFPSFIWALVPWQSPWRPFEAEER